MKPWNFDAKQITDYWEYFWETETMWVGERERESQEGSVLRAEPKVGLELLKTEVVTWAKTESPTLNWLIHPGALGISLRNGVGLGWWWVGGEPRSFLDAIFINMGGVRFFWLPMGLSQCFGFTVWFMWTSYSWDLVFELAFDFVFLDLRTLSGNKICRGNSK